MIQESRFEMMKSKKGKLFIVTFLLLIALIIPASARTATVTFGRGSFLMWANDYVRFSYDGTRILGSQAWQECGWIYPNKAWVNGISKVQYSTNVHKYRGKKTFGAVVPTPWGETTIYNTNRTDEYKVFANGSYVRC